MKCFYLSHQDATGCHGQRQRKKALHEKRSRKKLKLHEKVQSGCSQKMSLFFLTFLGSGKCTFFFVRSLVRSLLFCAEYFHNEFTYSVRMQRFFVFFFRRIKCIRLRFRGGQMGTVVWMRQQKLWSRQKVLCCHCEFNRMKAKRIIFDTRGFDRWKRRCWILCFFFFFALREFFFFFIFLRSCLCSTGAFFVDTIFIWFDKMSISVRMQVIFTSAATMFPSLVSTRILNMPSECFVLGQRKIKYVNFCRFIRLMKILILKNICKNLSILINTYLDK